MHPWLTAFQTRWFATPAAPREFPPTGFEVLPNDQLVEEEALAASHNDKYYPARIGEVFQGRYQAVGKLGYGTTSTVWLCKDLRTRRYYALKICTRLTSLGILCDEENEIAILKRLKALQHGSNRNGVRSIEDSFSIKSANETEHVCMLLEPLGTSIKEFRRRCGGSLPVELVRATILELVCALHFLHDEANIVHTDLQDGNILLGIHDPSLLADYEEAEMQHPVARKFNEDSIIYLSRPLARLCHGRPVIVDFGEARDGTKANTDFIMPDVYRAPEVVLGAEWDYKVDVWSLAVLAWTLLETSNLFNGRLENGNFSLSRHFAEMVALIGRPPPGLVTRGSRGLDFFDEDGSWKDRYPIPEMTLEGREECFEGAEKTRFLAFLRKTMQWDPMDRPTAKDLLQDEWLTYHLSHKEATA